MTVPLPWQRGHGREKAKKPSSSETTPRPRHSGQICGAVPGSAPVPWQTEHVVSSSTGILVSRPLSESSKDTLTTTSTSRPRSPPCPRPELGGPARAARVTEDVPEEIAEVAEISEIAEVPRPVEVASASGAAAGP